MAVFLGTSNHLPEVVPVSNYYVPRVSIGSIDQSLGSTCFVAELVWELRSQGLGALRALSKWVRRWKGNDG